MPFGPSVSPISMGADPVIASGSPPLGHLDRGGSADFFPGSYEQPSSMPDHLSDLYSKQMLSVHGSPPAMEDDQMVHFPMGTPDVHGM